MSMSEPKRMHPVAAIAGFIAALKEFLVPLVVVYLFGRGGNHYDGIFLLFLLIPFFAGVGRWWRFTYHMEGTTLKVSEGLLVRKKVTLPKNRVQSVDITAGLIQRLFGLVSVKVRTAGNDEAAVDLTAVSASEAREIMETLRGGSTAGTSDDAVPTMDAPSPVFRMNLTHLLAAGATSGQIGVILSVIITLFSQFDELIDLEELMQSFESWAPFLANSYVPIILLAIVGTWLLAIAGTVITYHDFSLVRREKELVVRYGLLKTKQVSIPFNRVQAVRFSEGILRQPLGFGALYVESAGQGDERQTSSCIIAPYIHSSDIDRVLGDVLPEMTFAVTSWNHPPKRAQMRYIVRLLRPSLVVSSLVAWFVPFGWIALVLIPLSAALGYAQYRTAAYQIIGDKLLMRSRSIGRTTVVLRRARVQSASYRWNPLMHRRDLWSYSVTLASVSKNLVYGLSYLGMEQQPEFVAWFPKSATGQPSARSDNSYDLDVKVLGSPIPEATPGAPTHDHEVSVSASVREPTAPQRFDREDKAAE